MTTIIAPRVHDLGGGFNVRRAVPSLQARSVGPFVFVDHMGPAVFEPGRGIDVRPHPHIGLATVTFLWSGAIHHRDTLGSEQVIAPGDVNWMTAGRGIAHSERTPADVRTGRHDVHGMQTWVALPKSYEEVAPEFHHHAVAFLDRAFDQAAGAVVLDFLAHDEGVDLAALVAAGHARGRGDRVGAHGHAAHGLHVVALDHLGHDLADQHRAARAQGNLTQIGVEVRLFAGSQDELAELDCVAFDQLPEFFVLSH